MRVAKFALSLLFDITQTFNKFHFQSPRLAFIIMVLTP